VPEDRGPRISEDGTVSTETGDEAALPPQRGQRRTVGAMFGAMTVVLLLIGAVALITFRPSGGDEVRVVDYADELDAARRAAPYSVLAPVGLDGFRATSVRYTSTEDGIVWHLGFVSPLEEYVGLDQTDGPAESFVDDLTEGAVALDGSDGSVEVAGRSWQRYDEGGDTDGERVRGLVTHAEGATVLVSGTAGWGELEEFAAALSPTAG
jgi:hypothetical protein